MSASMLSSTRQTKRTSMSAYTKSAQALIERIRAMQEEIPNFVIPDQRGSRPLVSAATLPPEFIELATAAAQNHTPLQRGEAAPPEQVRALMDYAKSYVAVADEFEAMAGFV